MLMTSGPSHALTLMQEECRAGLYLERFIHEPAIFHGLRVGGL